MSQVSQFAYRLLVTVRRRWWVAPIVISLALGFVWAQESEFRTTPGSYSIDRTYELTDGLNALLAVGIQPQAVVPVPTEKAQLALLTDSATMQRISEEIGGPASVTIRQSEQQVQFVSAVSESGGQNAFTFRFIPSNVFTFSCTEESRGYCPVAIQEYVEELVTGRTSALLRGISDLRTILDRAAASMSGVESNTLFRQVAALEALEDDFKVNVSIVRESVAEEGATIDNVSGGSLTFAVLIAALIVILIWVQMALADRKVHDEAILAATFRDIPLLGRLNESEASLNFVAAAISHRAEQAGVRELRLVPVTQEIPGLSERLLRDLPNLSVVESSPLRCLSVKQIRAESVGSDLIVVCQHRDKLEDVSETIRVLSHSGRIVLGMIMLVKLN